MPFSVHPDLYPGVVVVGVGPSRGIYLPCRDAGCPERRHRQHGLLAAASLAPVHRSHRGGGPAVRRLVGGLLVAPVVDLEGGIVETHSLHTSAERVGVSQAEFIQVLIVHPERQHEMAELPLRNVPAHPLPHLQGLLHVPAPELAAETQTVRQRHAFVQPVAELAGLVGNFQAYYAVRALLFRLRQFQSKLSLFGGESDRSPFGIYARRKHVRLQLEDHFGQLPVQHVHEETVAPACAHAPILLRHHSGLCGIYAAAVALQPPAHILQSLQRLVRQGAVRPRAYVQQQVGSLAGRAHQVLHQILRRTVVLVGDAVAPAPVHGLAGLQGQAADVLSAVAELVVSRDIPFENLYVLSRIRQHVVVVAHQAGRLQAVYQLVLGVEIPNLRLLLVRIHIHIPQSVEPDCAYRPVIRQQLGQLAVHKVQVVLPLLSLSGLHTLLGPPRPGMQTGASKREEIVPSPVQVGVIEVQLYSLLAAGLGEFSYHVPPERAAVHYIVCASLRLEHREAVVMAAGDSEVLRSGSLDGLHPLAGVEFRRTEAVGQMGIFLMAYVPGLQRPLSLSEH